MRQDSNQTSPNQIGGPSLTDLLQSHVPSESLPNSNIHPQFLKAFTDFGDLHHEDDISFDTIFRHWTRTENIHFTDLQYDHDIYLYHIASKFNVFGLWNEMRDLIIVGSFFHQVRKSGGINKMLSSGDDSSANNKIDESGLSIFLEASRLPQEKEPIQKYLEKYLPSTAKNENKKSINKSATLKSSKTGIIAKYRDDMTGITLNQSQHENMSMKQLVKKLARDVNVSLKSVRTLLNDKPVLLTEIGHNTPKNLNIKDGDIIHFIDLNKKESQTSSVNTGNKKKVSTRKKKPKNATIINNRRKKKANCNPLQQNQNIMRKKNIEEVSRFEHSRNLSKVFEEAGSKFKTIRTNLNNLNIKKTKPKETAVNTKTKTDPREEDPLAFVQLSNTTNLDDGIGGKAGKSVYTVRIGEATHLYKSGKLSRDNRTSSKDCAVSHEIDLHRMTKEEARVKLNEMLPIWLRVAMESSYPWVLQVRIVCGGGNQVLSEMVQGWIKEKECVANAF